MQSAPECGHHPAPNHPWCCHRQLAVLQPHRRVRGATRGLLHHREPRLGEGAPPDRDLCCPMLPPPAELGPPWPRQVYITLCDCAESSARCRHPAQNFAKMQLSEIRHHITARRNRIFLLMEELRRLRIQQRLKVGLPTAMAHSLRIAVFHSNTTVCLPAHPSAVADKGIIDSFPALPRARTDQQRSWRRSSRRSSRSCRQCLKRRSRFACCRRHS